MEVQKKWLLKYHGVAWAKAWQVLVDVEAAGINYMDIYQRKGIYKACLPIVLGLGGIGTISAHEEVTQSNGFV